MMLLALLVCVPLELDVFADPRFHMEGGVRTVESVHRAFMLYDEALSERMAFDESTAGRKALAITGRALKLAFLDAPVAVLAAAFAHEVFGHGTRAREFGRWPTYLFALPPPYSYFEPKNVGYIAATLGGQTGVLEQDLAISAAGMEANYALGHWLSATAAKSGGQMRYSDAVLYVAAKVPYLTRMLFGTIESTSDPDDFSDYVQGLTWRAGRFDDGAVQLTRERLRFAAIGNLADPVLLASLWRLVTGHLWRGDRRLEMFTFQAAGFTWMPATRFNLSPNGPEQYLDLFLFKEGVTLNMYARAVTSGLLFAAGGGARLHELKITDWCSLGAELDLFMAPQVVFEQRNVFNRKLVFGANYGVTADFRLWGPLRIIGRAAYKTRGHVFGQPLLEGVHGYLGFALRL